MDNAIVLTLAMLEMRNKVVNVKESIYNGLRQLPMGNNLFHLEQYVNYRVDKHFYSFMVNAVTF